MVFKISVLEGDTLNSLEYKDPFNYFFKLSLESLGAK